MKLKELEKQLNDKGWVLCRISGGHHIFSHPTMTRPVILCHGNKDFGHKLVAKIMKEAERNKK